MNKEPEKFVSFVVRNGIITLKHWDGCIWGPGGGSGHVVLSSMVSARLGNTVPFYGALCSWGVCFYVRHEDIIFQGSHSFWLMLIGCDMFPSHSRDEEQGLVVCRSAGLAMMTDSVSPILFSSISWSPCVRKMPPQGVERRNTRDWVRDVHHGEHVADDGGFKAGEERGALLGVRRIFGEPHVPLPGIHALSQVSACFAMRMEGRMENLDITLLRSPQSLSHALALSSGSSTNMGGTLACTVVWFLRGNSRA